MTEYEAFAVELAREAARVTLPFFRSDIGHEDKGGAAGFDPVTEADKQAEAAIRRRKGVPNPWGEGATTLEWTLSSPPPQHQFNELPVVTAEKH